MLFQRAFELERRRYQLALQSSMRDLVSRADRKVMDMKAERFLELATQSEEFENTNNLSFRVPEGGNSLEMLTQIARLFEAPTAESEPRKSKSAKDLMVDPEELSRSIIE